MCIFTGKANVSKTHIFARLDGDRQLIVYQMNIEADDDLAMVLPIPEASSEDNAVEFVNLEKHAEFFDTLEELRHEGMFGMKGTRRMKGMPPDELGLKVETVGAFEASYVPAQEDFERLDERFRLPRDVLEKLPQYEDHGFVVFKFRKGNHESHPMAFWFKTSTPGHVYFPTVHVHDGEVHEKEKFDHQLSFQADFDIINFGMKSLKGNKLKERMASDSQLGIKRLDRGWTGLQWNPKEPSRVTKKLLKTGLFEKENPHAIWSRSVRGTWPNQDVIIGD